MGVSTADLLPRAPSEVPQGVLELAPPHAEQGSRRPVGDQVPVGAAQTLGDALEAVLRIVAAEAEIVYDVIVNAWTVCCCCAGCGGGGDGSTLIIGVGHPDHAPITVVHPDVWMLAVVLVRPGLDSLLNIFAADVPEAALPALNLSPELGIHWVDETGDPACVAFFTSF